MADERLTVEERLAVEWPPGQWADVGVLVAVSGGPDSVALLRAMVALKRGGRGQLAVAHFNHRMRGEEAAEDERFVVQLCDQLGVACHVGRGGPAGSGSDGLEGALRKARYRFLETTANRLGARYVVTAHTADDQAETVLHRIVRGTGIAGLAGIPRTRPLGPACVLMRPLLGVRRSELIEYLRQLGQPYRRDSSNEDLRFTRNRIRLRLLPELASHYNPHVVEALLRLSGLAAEVQQVVDGIVEELMERHVRFTAAGEVVEVAIDAGGLGGQPRYLVRQLLTAVWRRAGWSRQAMGFAEWDVLADLLAASAGQTGQPLPPRHFPGAITARPGRGVLRLEKPAAGAVTE